ncbi:MAG: hypothetical protein EA392_12440 [Cryomorphaceae bacterium]|nr:MAG: hypothetical protein EA392_12440 [Cryomorphaceae bacterium]
MPRRVQTYPLQLPLKSLSLGLRPLLPGISEAKNLKWKEELNKAADRYHEIGAWVAVVFNLVFSLNDYFVIQEEWFRFFVFRAGVSAATLITLLIWRHYRFPSAYMIFVPYVLICIENAYMWSFMEVVDFRTHTLAYMAIYIGAAMLIVWQYYFSVAVVILSTLANVAFLKTHSQLTLEEIMTNGGILVGSVACFSVLLIQTRYRLNKREIIARLQLAESKKILQEQKEIIEENHRDITDSIRYAEKIQHSMLPNPDLLNEMVDESFVFFKPRDIVSGDFYWFYDSGKHLIVAAVDCTGHGVPGALMSMLGHSLLSRAVVDNHETDPAKILDFMRHGVIQSLRPNGTEAASGGMDMSICVINREAGTLHFAGAFNPLLMVRNGEVTQISADRMPVGAYPGKDHLCFSTTEIKIEPGDGFYMYSDGFTDQFGGPKNRKFGSKQLRELLSKVYHYPMHRQNEMIQHQFKNWKGSEEQLDDVVMIGFKVQ